MKSYVYLVQIMPKVYTERAGYMSTLQFRQHVCLHTPLRGVNVHQESQRRLTKTFPSTRNFIG
ncbi:hypothetical protein YC2023_092329 [Brassica napus]